MTTRTRGETNTLNNCFLRIEGATDKLGDGPKPGGVGSSAVLGNILQFSNLPPELGNSKSASVSPIHILGRSSPLYVYSYSDERAWNLELKFFADTQNRAGGAQLLEPRFTDPINKQIREQVLDKLNWCESLIYPIYKEGISRGLPRVTFVFGDMLNVPVICTDVSTSIPGPWFIKSSGSVGFPMFGVANLTLKQVGQTSFSHLDVRSNIHNGAKVN